MNQRRRLQIWDDSPDGHGGGGGGVRWPGTPWRALLNPSSLFIKKKGHCGNIDIHSLL
jgi:hypothetical protein